MSDSDASDLASAAEALHDVREALARKRGVGLTELFYDYCDPSNAQAQVDRWRQAQVEVDQIVARCYGWTDISLGHDFRQTPRGFRFMASPEARARILLGLLSLNHERHAEETQTEHKKGRRKSVSGRSKRSKSSKGAERTSKTTRQSGFDFADE